MNTGEIVLYQPDNSIQLDVRVEADTVWLTQSQMALLFSVDRTVIVKHISNVYKTCELDEISTCVKIAQVHSEGKRNVIREHKYYNLDMIISVGYRVNSVNATKFRQWATQTLKGYLLRGYAVSQRIDRLEQKVEKHDKQIEFFVRTALSPKEGVFYDGQIFDAYQFVSDLIRSAKESIVLIDNYADDSVLTQLTKRAPGVSVILGVSHITDAFRLDIERHNRQYPPVQVMEISGVHDRFLLLDNSRLYTFGASFKDLGRKLFCFTLMENPAVVAAVRQLCCFVVSQ